MVDLGDGQSRLRDGIYVLRMDDMLSVKRIALEPQGKRASVLSDNPAYPSWRGLERRSINIVGRVLWFGRALQLCKPVRQRLPAVFCCAYQIFVTGVCIC